MLKSTRVGYVNGRSVKAATAHADRLADDVDSLVDYARRRAGMMTTENITWLERVAEKLRVGIIVDINDAMRR